MATDLVPKAENFHLNQTDEDVICPSCDAKIKRSQVEDHCQLEMQRLHTMQLRSATDGNAAAATNNSQSLSQAEAGPRKPWSVFQRVQRNRQTRQRQRTRKRPTPPPSVGGGGPGGASSASVAAAAAPSQATETSCPVCNKSFPQAQIQEHANQCLRLSRRNGQSNGQQCASSDDEDDSEEYEEYEWAGQKRIRVSTLVQGGYGALNLGQTVRYNGEQQQQQASAEDEDDVNVDEDDTHIYGPTQYGEVDVIPLLGNEDDNEQDAAADITSYVRRLISSHETPNPQRDNVKHSSETTTETASSSQVSPTPTASTSKSAQQQQQQQPQNQHQIIESLKARLRLFEQQAQSKLKCLICIDDYKNPAISVSCWHVHCEQCWLQTLGARKLCPQCNSITTPKDLRRIYL